MVDPVHETADRAIGRIIGGDTSFGEKLPRPPRRMLAEPRRDHIRTAEHRRFCGGDRINHRARSLFGLRQRSGAVEHENGIDLVIVD